MDEDTEFQEMKVAHAEKKESDRLAQVAAEQQADAAAATTPTLTNTPEATATADNTAEEEDKPKKRGRPKKEASIATTMPEVELNDNDTETPLEASLSVAE
jgi:hypothetical protein